MGRKRKSRRDLPERMYEKHGAFYLVNKDNIWLRLGKTFPEAMMKYAEMVVQREKTTTIAQVIERYELEILPGKAPGTIVNETRFLFHLKKVFGDMRPQDVKPAFIYQYMDKRAPKSGKATANMEKAALSNIYNAAIRWGIAEKNPCKEVKRITTKRRSRYMTDDEFKLLYNSASPQVQCVMDIAYITGLRKGDILKIKLADITDGVLNVTTEKTKKKLAFTIEGELSAIIERAKKIRGLRLSPYLFCTHKGAPITKSNFDVRWFILKKKVGLSHDVTFHDIRGKSATDAKEQGRDAQKLLGHASGIMTETYIKERQFEKVTPLSRAKMDAQKDENIRQTP